MVKPLDSLASFRPIFLTSSVSKLFECIILSRLLFFQESNSILSPCQADFHPGQSTLKQILFLSQFILNGFNKAKPGSPTIFATINLSKVFDSVCHSTLFYKLISASLLFALLVWLNVFFLVRCLSGFSKSQKSFLSSRSRSYARIRFSPTIFFFSSTIFLLLCLLPSAVLFMLTTWPFGSPSTLSLVQRRLHKELWFDWDAGLSTGIFLSIRTKVRPLSSSLIPANRHLFLLNSLTASFSLHLFLGSPLAALFLFLNIYLRWRPSFRSGDRDWWLCSFSFWQKRLWCPSQLLTLWHWGHSFLFIRSKFFRWSLRHSAKYLLVSAALTNQSFLFFSPPLSLSSPPSFFLHQTLWPIW